MATAGFALVAHIGWSFMMVALMEHFYGHRILNLRKMKAPIEDRAELSAAFFYSTMTKAGKEQKPSAFFVGSSVTYGYPWQESVIFSKVIADRLPHWRVANLSLIGAGIQNATTCAFDGRTKPDVLVVEIPLIGSLAKLIKPGHANPEMRCPSPARPTVSYMELVLGRPYGLGWLTLLWDDEAYYKPDSDIQIVKLPSDYFLTEGRFAGVQSQFARELRTYVDALSNAADRVVFFVSPVYTAGIAEAGGDAAAVERQIQFAYAVCKENPKVSCIDPASLVLGREMFYNLTHLNQRGHLALGEYLAREIGSR